MKFHKRDYLDRRVPALFERIFFQAKKLGGDFQNEQRIVF